MREYTKLNKEVYNSLATEYAKRLEHYSKMKDERATLDPFIISLKKNFKKVRVLELGPGSGLDLKDLEKAGFETTAIDIAENIINKAKKVAPKTKYLLGDFLEYNFGGYQFEGIFARGFIHLFPKNDAELVIEKIKNLLVQNGIVFIGTTKDEKSEEGYFIKEDFPDKPKRFRKKWTEDELEEFVTAAGFKILKKYYHFEKNKKKKWMMFLLQK